MTLSIAPEHIAAARSGEAGHDPVSLALRPLLADGWVAACGGLFLELRYRGPGPFRMVRLGVPWDIASRLHGWLAHGRPFRPVAADWPELRGPWIRRG